LSIRVKNEGSAAIGVLQVFDSFLEEFASIYGNSGRGNSGRWQVA